MNRTFSKLLAIALIILAGIAPLAGSAQLTGPSSSQSSYVLPVATGVTFTSILSANDSVNGYKMSGIPDGLGAFDNGDGTFTLLMNHEILSTLGVVRAHGSIGSFVSKWIINKQDLSVISGSDLMHNVKLWNGNSYDTYNAANPSSLAAFSRFCSADLPPVSAFYNATTGMGTQERIYMNGEEISEGRAMAHIVTGPNAGTSYQLPYAGKMAFENQVACPYISDKTIVGESDDASITTSNVYFYVGTKTNTGTEIDKAGLSNGKLYGVKIASFPQERVNSTTINNPPVPGTHFDLVNLGPVQNLTGASLDSASLAAGATYFSRSEDVAWDPSNTADFYFNTTDQIDQVNDSVGTQVGRSRVWHLHFTDIANPELGGTVEAVLDGTEGQVMLDNLTIDRSGHIIDLEDVGNNAHNGKVWYYNIATDALTQIGKHDPARFGDIGVAATSPFTQDEETSGVIDVQSILGPGMYLLDDQAHYTTGIPANIVEGGQLIVLHSSLSNDCHNYTASINPAGTVTYCHNVPVTLTASGGYGLIYQWYKGNVAIDGATDATLNTTDRGKFYVVESNGACIWTSPVTMISRLPGPNASIEAPGGLDLCNAETVTLKAHGGNSQSTFLWYLNAVPIPGATSRKISVTGPGDFSVKITNANGCSATSAPVSVIKSCKLGDQPASTPGTLSLYPNPASSDFMIELSLDNDFNGTADIQMINSLGQVVLSNISTVIDGHLQQQVNPDHSLANGNYYVRVIAGEQVFAKKIMLEQ